MEETGAEKVNLIAHAFCSPPDQESGVPEGVYCQSGVSIMYRENIHGFDMREFHTEPVSDLKHRGF